MPLEKNKFITPILILAILSVGLMCFCHFGMMAQSGHNNCAPSSMADTNCPIIGQNHHKLFPQTIVGSALLAFLTTLLVIFILAKTFLEDNLSFRFNYNHQGIGHTEKVKFESFKRLYYWIALNNKYRESKYNGCMIA